MLHYATLRYNTLHYVILHYVTLYYFTLQIRYWMFAVRVAWRYGAST